MRPLLLLIVAVILTSSSTGSDTSPWVHSGDAPIPPGVIRVTTLGSGSPDVRKEQVASGFLLELGNAQQDKFIWDLGTGAYLNLWATGVPMAKLNKVFLTHLHSDHLADLATLYVAAKYGRTTPLEVWGPSGEAADMGTAAAVQGLRQFLRWDTVARRRIDLVGRTDDGDTIVPHEFNHTLPHQVVYNRNGVVITATPVEHYNTPGPVAYRLDWAGLSVTYSGDTRPVQRLIDLAVSGHGSDLLILQNQGPIRDPASLSYETQLLLNTSHITPQQAGPILSLIKPRLAVAHHLAVNDGSRVPIITHIRQGYPKGDLVINEDLNVVEVSSERVELKKRLVPTRNWGYWARYGERPWRTPLAVEID